MPSASPPITPYVLSPHVADLVVEDGGVRYRDESLRRRKVAICGGPGQRDMPWDDPAYECWAMNNFWNGARDSQGRIAASRWFEQHQIFPDPDGLHYLDEIQNANDLAWIRECPVPLYTTEPFPENPTAVVFDVDALVAKGYRDYFTCTFAYQVALALDEGFRELRVCGIELLLGTKREATVESACFNYWLGLAEGRGMRIDLAPCIGRSVAFGRMAPESQFLLNHPWRYGHEYWLEADFTAFFVSRWDTKKVAV